MHAEVSAADALGPIRPTSRGRRERRAVAACFVAISMVTLAQCASTGTRLRSQPTATVSPVTADTVPLPRLDTQQGRRAFADSFTEGYFSLHDPVRCGDYASRDNSAVIAGTISGSMLK